MILSIILVPAFFIFCLCFTINTPNKNIILIILDTVRKDRLGCYGNTAGITPQIDDFADHSVLFENAFSHAPWTLPSVASLLTSTYPFQHQAGGHLGAFSTLLPKTLSVTQIFRNHGVTTYAITNCTFLSERYGVTKGFETINDYPYQNNFDIRRAKQTTNTALKWLDSNKKEPFFLLIHYFDPHLVYDPPQPFRRRFADYQDREVLDHVFGTKKEMLALRSHGILPSEENILRLKKLYNGEIAYTDAEVGRLIRYLFKNSYHKNTIIIITADHGEEFLDHGGLEHGHTLYDELLHVPLIIYDPTICSHEKGIKANSTLRKRVKTTVRLIDIAPTLCELSDLPSAPDFLGKSLVPLLKGEQEDNRPVLSQGNMWGPSGTSLRNNNKKLIIQTHAPYIRLFNITTDPKEKKNIAHENQETVRKMKEQMNQLLNVRSVSYQDGKIVSPEFDQDEIDRLRSLGYMK